jgi:hypothetical protein
MSDAATAARCDPTASSTADRSSVQDSTVSGAARATGSDRPTPRLSNRITRENEASPWKKAAESGSSHSISRCVAQCGIQTRSVSPCRTPAMRCGHARPSRTWFRVSPPRPHLITLGSRGQPLARPGDGPCTLRSSAVEYRPGSSVLWIWPRSLRPSSSCRSHHDGGPPRRRVKLPRASMYAANRVPVAGIRPRPCGLGRTTCPGPPSSPPPPGQSDRSEASRIDQTPSATA